MNYLQLLARRIGQASAILRDPDAGLLRPLPEPAVDPRRNAEQISREAHEQGLTDGRRYLFDGWSFGHPGEASDALLDPEYVLRLRQQCETAVHEHRDRQVLTDARLADLHLNAREAERSMRSARARMAQVAVREQRREDDSLRSFVRRRDLDPDQLALPPLEASVWEGDAPPLRPVWRVLIVAFLLAVVFVIERYVAEAYLPVAELGRTNVLLLTGAICALTVLGPLLSGHLFRNRHSTGYDRPLAALTFVLLLPTLVIISGFGLLAATLFDQGVTSGTVPAAPAGASQSAALGLTPATLIVVFDVVLFLACAMAYLLGLAQPHPFQQAFARSRRLRDRTINVGQRMGTRINADYRATLTGLGDGPEGEASVRAVDRETAIRHAYGAAEDAYYQGLIEAVADPTFTEAVMRRRNRVAVPTETAGRGPAGAPQPDPATGQAAAPGGSAADPSAGGEPAAGGDPR